MWFCSGLAMVLAGFGYGFAVVLVGFAMVLTGVAMVFVGFGVVLLWF